MQVPLSYHLPAMFGSAAERAALFDDIRARGILEAHDLSAFVDAVALAIEDAEVRAEEARTEAQHAALAAMSDAEFAAVELKITDAFDRLIDRNPAISDQLFEACRALIEAVR
jgi:hypothetical protein